jgi:hypothetical protein
MDNWAMSREQELPAIRCSLPLFLKVLLMRNEKINNALSNAVYSLKRRLSMII